MAAWPSHRAAPVQFGGVTRRTRAKLRVSDAAHLTQALGERRCTRIRASSCTAAGLGVEVDIMYIPTVGRFESAWFNRGAA